MRLKTDGNYPHNGLGENLGAVYTLVAADRSTWCQLALEQFSLTSMSATSKTRFAIAVQGDHLFRPVDFALASDGSLFFTDWVNRSYPVHGQGRNRATPRNITDCSRYDPGNMAGTFHRRTRRTTNGRRHSGWPNAFRSGTGIRTER